MQALNDSIVQRVDPPLATPMGDEFAMMDLDTGKYLVLDPVGAVVWAEIAEPITVDELVARLVERFEVTRETCRADVLAFLEQLRTRGLLRASER